MKKCILQIIFLSLLSMQLGAQVYLDQFDNGTTDNVNPNAGYTTSEADGEWTVVRSNDAGVEWNAVSYSPHDQATGAPMEIDMSGNNKVFLKAKASNIGAQVRMDVGDSDGYFTTQNAIIKTLLNDYVILEFDFTGALVDAGWGGTACGDLGGAGNCPVDPTKISTLTFFLNPGVPQNGTTMKVDYISFGSEPSEVPMSDVWQDHFDDVDSTITWTTTSAGYMSTIADSKWTIQGEGTAGPYDPMTYQIHNQQTFVAGDIDVTGGDSKLYVRMKANVPGVQVRFDMQDIDNFISTAGSVTKGITEEFQTYEYNFNGFFVDLGWGGTACMPDPPGSGNCPVDPTRISGYLMFINPGVEAFSGEVTIEYMSIGTPLEAVDPTQNVSVYGDHFGNDDGFGVGGPFLISEANSNLIIEGDGSAQPYNAVSYSLHNQETLENVIVDATGNNKVYFKAKSSVPSTLLRVDLVDTAGYTTSLVAFQKAISTDYNIFELDFTGQYIDGGYAPPCDFAGAMTCPVDPTAIGTVLFYPNPVDGGFTGAIDIDWVSFGAPLEDEVETYEDQFDDDNQQYWGDANGFTEEEIGGEMILTGDGTAGVYTPFGYTPHDKTTLEALVVDLTPNNKVWVKAKSTVDGTQLRLDVQDVDGFMTNQNGLKNTLSTDYQILEYNFTDNYLDGAFGGPCTTAPCLVDGSRIGNMLIFIDPDDGAFNGTVTIDWISTINPLEDPNPIPVGILGYNDEFTNGDNATIGDPGGIVTTESEGTLTITGDGSPGLYAAVSYNLHDQDNLDAVLANAVGGGDKVWVRAKSSVDGVPFRLDLIDYEGFVTNANATQFNLTNDYVVYEYDFANKYSDGGFTEPCASQGGPCPVDGERVATLLFYPDPDNGGFNGTIDIDWISFGEQIVGVLDLEKAKAAKLYPMPVKDQMILEMDLISGGEVTVEIYDLVGQRTAVRYQSNQGAGLMQAPISMEALNSGMYILVARIDGQLVVSEKIIKE